MADELWVAQLGRIPYADALGIQEAVRERRQRDEIPDALLLLEHPPVYTRGRRAPGPPPPAAPPPPPAGHPARPPHAAGRPADGRGLVPDAGDRGARRR